MTMMNLFITVVVEGYSDSVKENEAIITPTQIDEFLMKWSDYDPHGTGFISFEQFAFLIFDLPPPLGIKEDNFKIEYDLSGLFSLIIFNNLK